MTPREEAELIGYRWYRDADAIIKDNDLSELEDAVAAALAAKDQRIAELEKALRPEHGADRAKVCEIVHEWTLGLPQTPHNLESLVDAFAAELKRQAAAKDREIARLQHYLERANWRRCNIAACNCNGYHNWNPSREEIEEPLKEERDQLRAEIERLKDNPEMDATDCAHPAWWRGNDAGCATVARRIQDALDGHDDGSGVISSSAIEKARRGVLELRQEVERLNRKIKEDEAVVANCSIRRFESMKRR